MVFISLCLWVDDGILVYNTAVLVLISYSYLQTNLEIKPEIANLFVRLQITSDRVNHMCINHHMLEIFGPHLICKNVIHLTPQLTQIVAYLLLNILWIL